MIFPQQTDLGRRVIYRPPEAGHRYGIITAIYPRRVFVRFDHQHFSRAVNPGLFGVYQTTGRARAAFR